MTGRMPALLGIDWGEKRIGVAYSDGETGIATPLDTIEYTGRKSVLAGIKRLAEEYQADTIVVGLPRTMKNEMGPAATKIAAHVDWLKAQLALKWVMWDERLSSREVERILLEADMSRARRKEVRDKLSAQRILQNYLDYHRNRQ